MPEKMQTDSVRADYLNVRIPGGAVATVMMDRTEERSGLRQAPWPLQCGADPAHHMKTKASNKSLISLIQDGHSNMQILSHLSI